LKEKIEEQKRQELKEIKELRQKTCFKATPIKYYEETESKTVVETKELTKPVGPKFRTDERAALKQLGQL